MAKDINPIIKMDYPDPDVIRVGDTYYMVSTTMYFMPGGALLRSYDLANWELIGYLFDTLDDTPGERMEQEQTEYAGGMWAPSIRYHEGMFYVFFLSHSGKKNYLFRSKKIEGPWEKTVVEGNYHDASLLFDGGKAYIVYGNTEIYITELNEELTGPGEGGLHRLLVKDEAHGGLGYEGAHIQKIGDWFYLFLINWPKGDVRTESCFRAKKLTDEFTGGVVLNDCRGIPGRGVAQGGIVETGEGKWYAVLFQDMGAAGRMPILIPVTWKDEFPVFGVDGKIPEKIEVKERAGYNYNPLYTSDDFYPKAGLPKNRQLSPQWQWNHQPDNKLWNLLPGGGLEIKTGKLCINLTHARNTLTQRMLWPKCEARVNIDSSKLNDGDYAGLCALQSRYAFVGIKKELGTAFLVVIVNNAGEKPGMGAADYMPGDLVEKIRLDSVSATVGIRASFKDGADMVDFYFMDKKGVPVSVGTKHRLSFSLAHFTGNRFGLCCFSTRKMGGTATFRNFEYITD